MTRREKILDYLDSQTENATKSATTKQIAEALGILRPNVSKELNQLVREGRVEKKIGRPVRYFIFKTDNLDETVALERKPNIGFAGSTAIANDAGIDNELSKMSETGDVFANMIGAHDSLKNQTEQAKAALLYPPHG